MGNIAEETAVLELVDSAEGTEQDAAEGEPEKKRRRVLPFLRAHKVAAGGIAAALVVGAIGIGEITSIPTAPAIAQADYRYDGERRRSLPLDHTPYKK